MEEDILTFKDMKELQEKLQEKVKKSLTEQERKFCFFVVCRSEKETTLFAKVILAIINFKNEKFGVFVKEKE